jgi:GNAT superfamily N-acetyltransferase
MPLRRLSDPAEADALARADLSDWFDPLLPHFAREALRCGGQVSLSEGDGGIDGLLLHLPAEHVASVFTRRREVALALLEGTVEVSVYVDERLGLPGEPFIVYARELDRSLELPALAHPVRVAGPGELGRIRELLLAVYGVVDERWLATMPSTERGFVVDLDGELAGAAFASAVAGLGRLHSLAVARRFRGLGLGRELVAARLAWLWAAGARRALSEIAERNTPSRRAAERSGMVPVGRIVQHERPAPPAPGPAAPP